MELRKDYILDRWMIISEKRRERPKQFHRESSKKEESVCFFCPGNEALTPPEIGRIEDVDAVNPAINSAADSSANSSAEAGARPWKMRWFPNKFPFAAADEDPQVKTDGKFFTHGGAHGRHEVIVETPSHEKQLWDLSLKDFHTLVEVYRNRIEDLSAKENINYVAIFKNHGPEGGTSLIHSHTQVVAFSHIPPSVREKIEASAKFDSCPYCRIADIESKSARKCFENETAVAFAPYASRFNYEMMIMPKAHRKTLSELSDDEIRDIAELIQKTLSKLKEADASFNMVLYYAPDSQDLHLHFEILPRLSNWAGFEFLTGIVINSVSPETSAKFYRSEE